MGDEKFKKKDQVVMAHLKAFFITIPCVFIIVAMTNALIDPSGIFFNRDRILRPLSSTAWLPMQRLVDGKETCHHFVFGTSRILVWDTTLLSNKPCKLSYPAKGLQSFIKGINTLIDHNIRIDSLVVTVERAAHYNQDRFSYKQSASLGLDYPSNVYDRIFAMKTLLYSNTYSNIETLLSEPKFEQYLRKSYYKSDQHHFRQLRYRWRVGETHLLWDKPEDHVAAVNGVSAYPGVQQYRRYQPDKVISILGEIDALSKDHDFDVTYVRAPIFLKNIVATNKDEFFDAYKKLADFTSFYDFSYDVEYLKAPELWVDYSHYNKDVAARMLRNIGRRPSEMSWGKYISNDNIDAHLKLFEENLYTYFINLKPHPPNTVIDESWLKDDPS